MSVCMRMFIREAIKLFKIFNPLMFVCIYQDFRGKLLRARFVRSSSSIQELNSIRCICLSLNSAVTIETGTLNGELNVRQALCAISVRPSLSYNPSL